MWYGMGTPSRRGPHCVVEWSRWNHWNGLRVPVGVVCARNVPKRDGVVESRELWSGLVSSPVASPRVVRTENGSGPLRTTAAQHLLEHHHHYQRGRGNMPGRAFSDCTKYIFTSLTYRVLHTERLTAEHFCLLTFASTLLTNN
jgi:hypothetical protein